MRRQEVALVGLELYIYSMYITLWTTHSNLSRRSRTNEG